MSIAFNQIGTPRVPGVFAEFDTSRAVQSAGPLKWRVLITGQKLAAGAWAANSVQKAASLDAVITGAGRGSMLHQMARAFFANNKFTQVDFAVLADDAGGTAASGTITVTGTSTAVGTLSIYIDGVRVAVAIANGTAQNAIATAIRDAINANLDLPVTAAASTNVVTITCRHKGEYGNSIDLRKNYQDTEADVAGVTLALAGTSLSSGAATVLASGATNPSLTTLIAALGDSWYQLIVQPYKDSTSLAAWEAELDSRNGPTRMIDGVAFTAVNDSYANLATLGAGRNSPRTVFVSTNFSPTSTAEYAAAVCAVMVTSLEADPGAPFLALPLAAVLPPAESVSFTLAVRDALLNFGVSTTQVVGGTVLLERIITTYKTTAAGTADTTYLDVETLFILLFLRYNFRSRMAAKFARFKLADDGQSFPAGQKVVTPSSFRGEVIAWFEEMQDLALVEHLEAFKASLVVERNVGDRNRLDCKLPVDLINFLAVTAVQFSFQL